MPRGVLATARLRRGNRNNRRGPAIDFRRPLVPAAGDVCACRYGLAGAARWEWFMRAAARLLALAPVLIALGCDNADDTSTWTRAEGRGDGRRRPPEAAPRARAARQAAPAAMPRPPRAQVLDPRRRSRARAAPPWRRPERRTQPPELAEQKRRQALTTTRCKRSP